MTPAPPPPDLMERPRVVWKYELQPGLNVLRVPLPSRIVHVGPFTPGADGPAVWIERDPGTPTRWNVFHIVAVGTGHDVPSGGAHIGSAWCGPFMWHVYEVPALLSDTEASRHG